MAVPMLRSILTLAVLLSVTPAARADTAAHHSPYSGQHQRAVKALSSADMAEMLAGRGWGFAKPAELNGYPGPVHLLELSDQIGLTVSQREKVTALFEDMQARAKALGAQYVEAEKRLDAAFSAGTIDPGTLVHLVRRAEQLRADLRLVHLQTHLRTRPLLTLHQVKNYARLRGYGAPDQHDGHAPHQH